MPSLPIIPASIAPPLRCERLEDRSLLSATMLSSVLGDSVLIEQMPGQELPVEGVGREIGAMMAPLDPSTIRTAEWSAGRDGLVTEEEYWAGYYEGEYWDDSETYVEYADEWYFEDDLYYEDENWDDSSYLEEEGYYDDSWYSEDETFYEEHWYYEEEDWDEAWYSDEAYFEEPWGGDYAFVDGDGMTWEEYEAVWLNWDRSEGISAITPDKNAGEWNVTLGDWTDLDGGMVYAMAVSGGIAIPGVPATFEQTPVVDPSPLPVPTTEEGVSPGMTLALPPVAADLATPPEVTAPQEAESTQAAAVLPPEPAGSDEAAQPPALAALGQSDDHLTGEESLELNEDLRVG